MPGPGCMHVRVLPGRDAPDPLEVAREMTLIGEADLDSSFRGRNAGAQQDAGSLDAQLQLVGVRGNARMERERARSLGSASCAFHVGAAIILRIHESVACG
jgi:hypothetical protein